MKQKKKEDAFTLIELSIVLVIIGLIVGGVLVGRELISAAAVRAQVSQIEKYQQAVNTFRGKYGYLPGDIKRSEAAQFGFASRGLYAGEGDGNAIIEGISFNNAFGSYPFSVFGGEQAMFWVDLSTARLVDGSFSTATATAVITTTVTGALIDKYFPRTKINNEGHVYVWSGGWAAFYGLPSDGVNYFAVTGVTGTANGFQNMTASVPLMTVAQAYAIDKKMDDGLPQSGIVTTMDGAQGWACGGPTALSSGIRYETLGGDYDNATYAPVTPATTSPYYAVDNMGATLAQTCFNDFSGASHTKTEHYSIEINNGTGVNCWLSFKFQ